MPGRKTAPPERANASKWDQKWPEGAEANRDTKYGGRL